MQEQRYPAEGAATITLRVNDAEAAVLRAGIEDDLRIFEREATKGDFETDRRQHAAWAREHRAVLESMGTGEVVAVASDLRYVVLRQADRAVWAVNGGDGAAVTYLKTCVSLFERIPGAGPVGL
jgi:hypothetical protein